MADENKKEQEEAAEEKTKKSGGLKKIILVWVPLFVVQLALSYFIVAKVFKKKAIEQDAVAAEAPKKKEKKPEKPGEIYLVEDVIANPKNTLGRHFVNVTVGLEEGNPKIGEELKNRDAQIRDVLIDILVGKTIEEIDDVEDKEALKKEIKTRLNKLLGEDSIRHVYFSNFIIQ